jgi:CBS domain-containing protein
MKVKDIMTPHAECVSPQITLQQAAQKMKELDVGTLLICDNDRLAGMVTDRDITIRATASGSNPASTKVRDVLTPEVAYCFDDQDADEAAQLMKDKQIRRLPVLNRQKRLVGIVSLGDLAARNRDRELVGDTMEHVCSQT